MKYFQFLIILIIPNILAQYAVDDRRINLEDIEDDNLLNEKFIQENDPLITQSTQHLRPPSILAVNPYLTHQSPLIYATPATEGEIHYEQPVHNNQKPHYYHPHQLQYLTQQQSPELLAEQNYNQQVYGTSLLRPIIPTIATYLPHPQQQQQQQQQPEPTQFLLPEGRSLHHRAQVIQQVVGGIQYVSQQTPSPVIYAHENQEISNEQKVVADDQIIYHHHHTQPQQIAGRGPTYLQYVPYITRGSNNGQYIIMAPIPAGYSQPTPITKPIISYSHSANPQQLVQYVPQSSNPVVGGIQYVTSNEIENVPEPHSHPVHIPYAPDYTNAFPKRPTKNYQGENLDQSNINYPKSYSDQTVNSLENSHFNSDKEEKQSENTKINTQTQGDHNVIPIKQVVSYKPQVQDIQYATPNSLTDEQNSDQEKSKQQQYAPQHPEKQQLETSKLAENYQFHTSNKFSSFQFTTANPISQRYYAAQKHITGTTKPNQYAETPTPSPQPWSHKVMPLQYQQYETRYSTPTAVSSTNSFAIKQGSPTTSPIKIQTNPIAAFRSPIPKYYIPTPKTIQSTQGPTTATFSITTNEPKYEQTQQQNYKIHSTPTSPSPKIIQPIQQLQQPINNQHTISNSETFGNRQPKSLLESYIPSWVVIENQNKERSQHQARISNPYNTITYSVPHNQVNGNHLKRSPTTITPTKLIKV